MPIDIREEARIALFLFAHQDDEFGVFHQILVESRMGRRVVCAYLTSGVQSGENPLRRNRESLNVLRKMGVGADDVVFAGALRSIADGCLVDELQNASDWLEYLLDSFAFVDAVYVPAWEGGHPDHDALHAVAVQVCAERGMGESVKQFPLYNSYGCLGPFFRVLSPLKGNGAVDRFMIPCRDRFRFLRYALSYPSQRVTWVGLFPFFMMHYVVQGWQELQPVSRFRIEERPHIGSLYYEKRRFSSWPIVQSRLSAWLTARSGRLERQAPTQQRG